MQRIVQAQTFSRLCILEQGRIEGGEQGQLEDTVVAAVALYEAGPFAELGEAGLEVRLEGEEGGEGVALRVGEWLGG